MAVQKLLSRVLTPGGTVLVPCLIPLVHAEENDVGGGPTLVQYENLQNPEEYTPEQQFYANVPVGQMPTDYPPAAENAPPAAYENLVEVSSQLLPGGYVNPQDLPIYGSVQGDVPCPQCEAEQAEVGPESQLQQGVTKVRQTVVGSVDKLKIDESRERVYGNVKLGIARVKAAYEFLTNEENYLTRAAAITSGGLFGLLMARRGGAIKKIFYTSTGLTAMASICYPKQAVVISEDLYKIGKYYAIVGYQKLQEADKPR